MIASLNQKKLAVSLFVLSLILTACGSNDASLSESAGGGGGNDGSGTRSGVTISNIYSQPKQLGVGDVLFADLNSSAVLDFDGVDSSAEFLFTIVNASDNSGQFAVTMSGDLSEPELDAAKTVYDEEMAEEEESAASNDFSEKFHDFLRSEEKNLEYLDIPEDSFSSAKSVSNGSGVSAAVSLGDLRSFKVLSSLSSTSNYVEVHSTAECIGSNVIFYVDSSVSSQVFSDADIQTLCDYFDPVVAKEQDLFGAVSDVDGNGKVVVLFTPQVNRLGALGGGIITGYFLANDLYPSNGSNPASNYMEILYIMVPDPNGIYGTAVSRSFAMSNLLPSVLPHELQHAINYNQHVFVYRGQSENSCLNEGLSHLAEDLMGQGQENASRYNIYLKSPQSYSIASCSQAGLGSRGGTYLFLRYLYEQSENGNAFARKLIQSNLTGIKNIDAAFGGRLNEFDQFEEFFLRWSVALTGVTADPRFSFKERSKDSATGQWQGACVICDAQDGRGTILRGVTASNYTGYLSPSIRPSAARFFKLARISGKLQFGSPQGGLGYGVLIRTK